MVLSLSVQQSACLFHPPPSLTESNVALQDAYFGIDAALAFEPVFVDVVG